MDFSEIGSEFWQNGETRHAIGFNDLDAAQSKVFLLSGRTAIDYIVRDILHEKRLEKVLLPSYCCDSMIEPFLRNGVDVSFYPVTSAGVSYDKDNDADAVLVMNYFGYASSDAANIASLAHEAGKTVIYDATHMINPDESTVMFADYGFCSTRKWFYSNYAWAKKYHGDFKLNEPLKNNREYVLLRDRAARLKFEYIDGRNVNKQEFLTLYGEAEEILEHNYVGYAGEPVHTALDSIVDMRRENARALICDLKDMDAVKLWREKVTQKDIPLFVPILLKNQKERDALRKYLIERKIYCPVHWPMTELHEGIMSDLYSRELSLICDQRYQENDMKRIICEVKNFFSEGKQ